MSTNLGRLSFGAWYGPYLAIFVLLLMVVALYIEHWRRARALARFGPDSSLARITGSLSARRRGAHAAVWLLGLGLVALAAGEPRVRSPTPWQQRGIDVVLVMDYSNSMLATDVYPSRLQRMTRAADALLLRSISNRVGVVVFAGEAAHFPLTHDREAARSMYQGLQVEHMPSGSNLGEAVRVGRCLIRDGFLDDPECGNIGGRGRGGAPLDPDAEAETSRPRLSSAMAQAHAERTRALIVFTDGEQTDGDAQHEFELATRLGVEVFIVGIGTVRGARVPDIDPDGHVIGWKTRPDGTLVQSRLDQPGLTKLSAIVGGSDRLFLIGLEGRPFDELPTALERLQKSELRGHTVTRYRGVYEWLLFPGFLLLVMEACISPRRSMRTRARVPRLASHHPGRRSQIDDRLAR